jgi:hypothetical protein
MPAKWQQWMPFRIDAFKGSPAVQAMHPCARIGYLYLLACAWQTEDCTVSNDALELAEQSGLGDELWAIHGPRILRKFEPLNGNGRLRNQVCFEEWERTRAAYQNRAKAADRTNTVRSPSRSPSENATVTVEKQDGNRAGTVYECVNVNVPVDVDSGSELMLANWLFEELGIVGGNSERMIAADAIRQLAKEGGTVKTSADYILEAGRKARNDGVIIDRFWFTKQKYRPQTEGSNGKHQVDSPAKQRIDGARRVLASIAIERGLYTPPDADGGIDAPVSER